MEKIEGSGGEAVVFDINYFGVIEDLDTTNFTLKPGRGFKIKNDGDSAVTLEVRTTRMEEGSFIETKFDTGWNPEVILEIKSTETEVDLKWGY